MNQGRRFEITMGATFCNLYCREEQADSVKNMLASGDRFLTGCNSWCVALAEDGNPSKMMRIARKTKGDVLVFFWFDDDSFELTCFQNGKKAASVNSGGKSSKLQLLTGLIPEDLTALKKLHALKDCISIEEKLTLLEETFGLPFYVLYEQETIPAARQSNHTWNAVKMRAEILRKRPNRFRIEELPQQNWPYSAKTRMDLIHRLRNTGLFSSSLSRLLYDIPSRVMEQPGFPYRLFTAAYLRKENEQHASGYNTIIMADYQLKKVFTYDLPYSIGRPLAFNSAHAVICESLRSESIICLNEQGEEQWRFAPELEQPTQRLSFIRTNREEIVLRSDYGSKDSENKIWRISPEDGCILTERVFPAGERLSGIRWLPDLTCFVCYKIADNSVIILDQEFNELHRFQLGESVIRFDTGFFSEQYGYVSVPRRDDTWYLVQLDLTTGKITTIHPEFPVFINQILSGGIFVCNTTESSKSLNLLDHDGKLISKHHFKDSLLGVWEEEGQIFAATVKPSKFPGFWEDSLVDTVKVFRFANE